MNFEELKETYGLKLNEAQSRAIQETEGAVLLLAVPGSGKTTVLVARLGYMVIGLGIDPASILTMTYTVAATHDMKERFCRFFGEEWRERVEFRTINGVCAKIIQSYERLTGGTAFSLITDEKELSALIGAIYKDTAFDFPTESDIKNIRTQITYAKNMMLSEDEIKALDKKMGISFSAIYKKYNEALKEHKRMDYDDQMVYAYRILKRYPRILEAVQNRYRYICVDEAQDTSKIQHAIIALLAERSGNLFMVGDEDQSIYGFRAAYPEALLSFEKDHPGAKVLLMEQNFRSDAHIVAAADRFVQKNLHRHEKHMQPTHPAKNEVKEILLPSRSAQYPYLLKVAANCKKETAVLYRDNECAIPLIDLLERHGISYRIRALDTSFFTHRVVQDIAAIIRFSYDPYDTEAFMQIYYKLTTYLNKQTAKMLCEFSKSHGVSVWDAMELASGLNGGTLKACRAVQTQMWKMQTERADMTLYRIDALMGYGEYLSRAGIKRNKLSILESIGIREDSALALLARLEKLSDLVKNRQSPEDCHFILSTVHSAKGLEYDTVFLIDAIDGLFPEKTVVNPAAADEEDVLLYEEDRRLFYVAATRAKNHLKIMTYKGENSVFCDEIIQKNQPASTIKKEGKQTEDFISFCKRYGRFAPITHKTFGRGTVLSQDGGMILVKFENGKTKSLSLAVLYEKSLTE
ncbi:MAG: ATP-dependent helicase [Clostridia bacterium]|nr:ATP-dependent helicase [Clostridia bacterium]